MYSCTIRDDTEQAIQAASAERHVPLGIECRQTAWAYSIPGYTDFNVINWKFFNRSGHELDSVVIGFRVDMDCGPTEKSNFFSDDFDVSMYPFGRFMIETKSSDLRRQMPGTHPDVPDADNDSALCSRFMVTLQGYPVADDDGDENKTLGVPHFLLLDHTVDPLGITGPRKVGFRAFRSFPTGQPYVQGGNPIIDQQRFEFMTSHDNIANDPGNPAMLGFINLIPGDQKSDYSAWASIGPWFNWAPNAQLECTVAMGVRPGDLRTALAYASDYQARTQPIAVDPLTQEVIYGVMSGTELMQEYSALDNALAAQLAFEGVYEKSVTWPLRTDYPGRETPLRAPPGEVIQAQGCESRDPVLRFVSDKKYEWFDFDCDYCTGAPLPVRRTVPSHVARRVTAAESEQQPERDLQLQRQPGPALRARGGWPGHDRMGQPVRDLAGPEVGPVRLPLLPDLEGLGLDTSGRLGRSRRGRLDAAGRVPPVQLHALQQHGDDGQR
jgi:hypothetical protein